jgi:hypothetical protein
MEHGAGGMVIKGWIIDYYKLSRTYSSQSFISKISPACRHSINQSENTWNCSITYGKHPKVIRKFLESY